MVEGDSLFRSFKTVSGAAHGPQIAGFFRVNFNLGAQFPYINVHGTRAYKGRLFPDRIQDLISGEDAQEGGG